MLQRLSRILVTALFPVVAMAQATAPVDTPKDESGELQSENSKGDQEVENLYERFDSDEKVKESKRKQKEEERRSGTRDLKPETAGLSDLKELSPFNDVAVIQRKFLPKTKRFEVSTMFLAGLNNSFFNNFGFDGRFGYWLTEKWGVDFIYESISSSKKQVTNDLEDLSVRTRNLVTPKSYMGLTARWASMYGKIAFMNKTIVPFELYFFGGLGQTATDPGSSSLTYTIGGGQRYALTKSMAFRWDITAHFYSVDVEQLQGQAVIGTKSQGQNDLHLTLGMSFFFPGAKYR